MAEGPRAFDGIRRPCRQAGGPIVIAHRGASGYVPEHTLAAYALAIEMGADYIEPDLVMTRDGVLVARHENELSNTTDVADRPEFAARKAGKTIDGVPTEGWFTEDFTLAELQTLRAKERIPHLRPANRRLDGCFRVPTFADVLDLVRAADRRFELEAARKGAPVRHCVGVYPETKHPGYFDGIDLPMEAPLIEALRQAALPDDTGRVYIQSFEVCILKRLRTMTSLPLVQLLNSEGSPYDFVAAGDPRTYSDLAGPAGLAEIAGYADGIGVHKDLIIPRNADQRLGVPSSLIADAHAADLVVHGWIFRAESAFLPVDFRSTADPAVPGHLEGEIAAFLAVGMDGFFTDQPDIGVRVRDAFLS